MSTQIVTFKPAGPVEAAWRRSRAPVKILLGPISSGKSTGAVSHIAELSMQLQPMPDGIVRARWLVVRNTYGALESATLRTINTVFPSSIGALVKTSPMRRTINLPGFELEFIMLALDNPTISLKSALGMEATGAWLDECRELPIDILQTILGRIGRYPPVRELGGKPYYAPVLGTSNMSDTASWLYRWFEKTPEGVEMFIQPSGLSDEHENKAGLPHPNWYAQQAQIVRPDYRRVMIEAQWGSVSMGDACVPSFSSDMHVAKEPLIVSPTLPLYCGIDCGPTLNPAAVIAQLDNGQLRVIDEWHATNKSTIEAATDFRQFCATRGYALSMACVDPSAAEQRDTMAGEHFIGAWRSILDIEDVKPAPTNSVEMRLEAARSVCNRLVDGRPALIIDPQCRHLIKALAGEWRFKQKRTAMGLLSEDTEIDKGPNTRPYSDYGDAFSYLVLASGEAGILSKLARPKRRRYALCTYCHQDIIPNQGCGCRR